MRPSSPALRDLLASRQFVTAALLTFTLIDGTKLRYCTGDRDITSAGHLFTAGGQTGPYCFTESAFPQVTEKIGTDVSTLMFTVLPGSSTVGSVPFRVAIKVGLFQGAEFDYERAYMPIYGDVSVGTVLRFSGLVGQVDVGRSGVYFSINSHTERLNKQLPINLFQPGCLNTLYDTGCTLSRAAFAIPGVVLAGTTNRVIVTGAISAPDDLDLGSIVFNDGVAATMARMIRTFDGVATLILASPLPVTPQPLDTFTAYPGCDKTETRCTSRFLNHVNFRGVPDIPAAETAV